MSKKDVTKEYSNGELTVVWQPAKCIHAGECTSRLPEVYHPKERPWIKPENATTEALKKQVTACPSGALTYYMNGEKEATNEPAKEMNSGVTKVIVKKGGPLLVHGTLNVIDKEGNASTKKEATAFCRCGASGNKPYCDGSHAGANFED